MHDKTFTTSDLSLATKWILAWAYYRLIPLPALLQFAKLRGLYNFFITGNRKLVQQNIKKILGENLTEQEIRSTGQNYYEFREKYKLMRTLQNLENFSIPQYWSIENQHYLDELLTEGKGVVILSAHFGYFNLIKEFLKKKGYKVWQLRAKISKRIKADQKKAQNLSRFGQFVYDRFVTPQVVLNEYDLFASFNIRPLLEVLNQNGVLIILGDGLHSANFLNLPLLGNVYPFPQGFMSLIKLSGAPVIPAFAVNGDRNSEIKLVLNKPFKFINSNNGTMKNDLINNMQHYVKILEYYIRKYPHHFKIWEKENWFERRLKRSKKALSKRY